MRVFVCQDTVDSILTGIFVAWEYALATSHEEVRLVKGSSYEMNIFEEYVDVVADEEKSQRVVNAICGKISQYAYELVYYAMLSCEDSAVDDIYRFLNQGFKVGPDIVRMYTDPAVSRILDIRKRVANEACSFREFVRFNSFQDSVYVSHIEPKNNVVMIVGNHFADRMPSEHWMIIDDARGIAVVHPKDQDNFIRVLTKEELERLKVTEDYKDEYTVMWKTFFDTIAIKERTNYNCQRNHFPIWKRKHVVEFEA